MNGFGIPSMPIFSKASCGFQSKLWNLTFTQLKGVNWSTIGFISEELRPLKTRTSNVKLHKIRCKVNRNTTIPIGPQFLFPCCSIESCRNNRRMNSSLIYWFREINCDFSVNQIFVHSSFNQNETDTTQNGNYIIISEKFRWNNEHTIFPMSDMFFSNIVCGWREMHGQWKHVKWFNIVFFKFGCLLKCCPESKTRHHNV